MCVWNEDSGRIALSDAFSIWAGMPRKRLQAILEEFTGSPCYTDDPQRASVLSTRALSFGGTEVACLCSLRLGRLRAIEFHPIGGTAAEQRKRFFGFIGKQDPCQDTMHSVLLRYPFGTAWIATDPRSGDASLRITYAVKE